MEHGLAVLSVQEEKKKNQRRATGMQRAQTGEDTLQSDKTRGYARPC